MVHKKNDVRVQKAVQMKYDEYLTSGRGDTIKQITVMKQRTWRKLPDICMYMFAESKRLLSKSVQKQRIVRIKTFSMKYILWYYLEIGGNDNMLVREPKNAAWRSPREFN